MRNKYQYIAIGTYRHKTWFRVGDTEREAIDYYEKLTGKKPEGVMKVFTNEKVEMKNLYA